MGIDIDQILRDKGVKDNEADTLVEDAPVEEPVIEDTPSSDTPNEDPVEKADTPKEDPIKEDPIKEDRFPEDRFNGKFKNWDEVNSSIEELEQLKAKEPENPFKDDYIKKVVDAYNQKGDLKDFFKAHAVDWKEMAAEDVLKEAFKDKYSGIDKKHINRLWDKEKEKYDLDSDDDDDIELGKALMERDANEIREQRVKDQEGYLQVEPKVETPKYTPEQIRESIKRIPEVDTFLKDKSITYKIGDEDFKLAVKDSNFILEALADDRVLINKFIKADGKHDIKGFIDVVNYANDPEGVRKAWSDHSKTLGKTEIIDQDYKNTTLKNQPNSDKNAEVSFQEGLAKAFAAKHKSKK